MPHPTRERVRALREAAGMSRRELAEAAGVSARAVEYLELRGDGPPGLTILEPLCRALGASIDEVVSGGHEPMEAVLDGLVARYGVASVAEHVCARHRPMKSLLDELVDRYGIAPVAEHVCAIATDTLRTKS